MQFAMTICSLLAASAVIAADAPQARDERLTVELFAENPDIMTPTGLAVASDGRVFVAESHTHFRPDDYDGPAADRILIFEDSDGDGRADKRTIFHEGFTHVMDIEFHHDGSLYVATRRDIHRMRDTDGDDKADEVTRIVWLDTKGDYPHNGLSGLAFDFDGGLNFGLGENLGADYTLQGTDGISFRGGGEGGSTYHVWPDGKRLRRVSTGWWNPYGMCTDAFGRVFGTDNDPGASPPCRLIQVIEGGNYGYEYRYGRTGLHPLICWNGEIPGTLPMISGTGEAPCAIVAYESNIFPKEYLGNLFVPCWADHRVERYTITQRADKGLVDAQRDFLVEGPDDFRPVGVDVAPDGTVYISDWVSSSYSLHKQGRIWRIRPTDQWFADEARKRVANEEVRFLSRKKKKRDRLGRFEVREDYPFFRGSYVRTEEGMLETNLSGTGSASDPLARLQRRLTYESTKQLSDSSKNAMRVLAARLEGATGEVSISLHTQQLLRGVSPGIEKLSGIIVRNEDPVLTHAAIQLLSRGLLKTHASLANTEHGLGILLAARRNETVGAYFAAEQLDQFLMADDPDTRFVAVKWIADDKLIDYRPDLERMLNSSDLDYRLFRAVAAAIDRLDDKEPTDQPSVELLLAKIKDADAPNAIRSLCLRMIPPDAKGLGLDDLSELTSHADPKLRLEAVRTLVNHPDAGRVAMLVKLATDNHASETVRAAAITGLATTADAHVELLLKLASGDQADLRDEALRSLVGLQLAMGQKEMLADLKHSHPSTSDAVDRILQQPSSPRPNSEQTETWKQLLTPVGDAAAGQRIFFGVKVGTCSKCHTIDGRGSAVGPDLSKIRERVASEGVEWLLETILQPSKQMAPQYTPWQIVTTDGKTLVGLPRRKGGNQEAYLGIDGREFTVKKTDIEFHREMPTSIMPEGLLQSLTIQELNDLLAYIVGGEQ
jgi:putative membrane-bound dehydrogenase-like protein